jgi:nitroreductase
VTTDAGKTATTRVPVHPLIAGRWSPRGFDATHRLDDDALTALLEAARWAPSAGNSQPWRFLVGRRGDATFDGLTSVLKPGNSTWAPQASALVLVAARTTDDEGHPRPWASYDVGLAVGCLTLQAQHEGLAVHQMGGFDAEEARRRFGLADDLTPVVVLAVGRRDPGAELPETLARREGAPRTREPLDALLLSDPQAPSRAA